MHIKIYFLDIAGFENIRVQHIVTSNEQKRNLGSLKTKLTGIDCDLAWDTNDHHILHSKVPTKVMHERYSQAMITIFNFWSYLAPSMNTLAQWSVSASADIFFDTWSFCNGSAPHLNFGALFTEYEMIKRYICVWCFPQWMVDFDIIFIIFIIFVFFSVFFFSCQNSQV